MAMPAQLPQDIVCFAFVKVSDSTQRGRFELRDSLEALMGDHRAHTHGPVHPAIVRTRISRSVYIRFGDFALEAAHEEN